MDNLDQQNVKDLPKVDVINDNDTILITEDANEHAAAITVAKFKELLLTPMNDQIKLLMDKVYPLTVSMTGGGVYEVNTTRNIALNWIVKLGDVTITDEPTLVQTLTVEGTPETLEPNVRSKVINDVTSTAPVTKNYAINVNLSGVVATASVNVQFVLSSYSGVIAADKDTITADEILAMTKRVASSKNFTTTVNLANEKLVYAYPKSFGALTSIKDANSFEYIDSYVSSELSINGNAYYVYVLANGVTIDNFRHVFS